MRTYKKAFDGYQVSEFRYLKFHQLLHYKDFVQRFGSVVSTAGYPWEGSIRFFLSNPYRTTNRKRQGLDEAIQRRVALR